MDVFDVFAFGYAEYAEALARRAWNLRSYTKPSEPTDPTPTKRTATTEERTQTAAPSQDAAQTDDAPAEGLELVDTAEGVAVVGDSRTTYRNRKQIKAHGATWNKEAQQWQASEPEAVARLREWFGVSSTPTASEGDTAHESEPQNTDTDRTEQDGRTHTTAATETTPAEATAPHTPESIAEDPAPLTAPVSTTTAEEPAATPTTESEAARLRRELAAMLDQARRMSERLAQLEQAAQQTPPAVPTAPTGERAA